MRIAVASGKGGTGKTMVATCLAQTLAGYQPLVIDADVEEPNAAFLLPHETVDSTRVTRTIPEIVGEKCNLCGQCARACQFKALAVLPEEVLVFPELCHSCGLCSYVCPRGAIVDAAHHIGSIESARLTDGGTLITGRLKPGEARSTPLISAVKKYSSGDITIIDCPPGTTCPMMEAVRGADYCVLVTEPTPFGLHDLKLALEVMDLLQLPCGVIINRASPSGEAIAEKIRDLGVEILAEIPFSREVAAAYARGISPLGDVPWLADIFVEIATKLRRIQSCASS